MSTPSTSNILNLAMRALAAAREWQDYCEQIERDTDAAMAEEIQRLRRDLPKAEARIRELEAAVLAEREACARVAESTSTFDWKGDEEWAAGYVDGKNDVAAAIRART